jgi:hypothetical protein
MTKLPSNVTPGQQICQEPDEARREAFTLAYFESGNAKESAIVAGIHYNTAMEWKRSKWFPVAIRALQVSLDKKLDGRITKILAKTLDHIENRIDKGDTKFFANKEGLIEKQVPISAKDLAVVTGVLFDKRTQLRKEPEQDDTASSALDRIADRLRQYALTDKLQGAQEVVDVEVKETGERNADING